MDSQADVKPADLVRKHRISEGTFHRWKAKYRRDRGERCQTGPTARG